VWALVFAFAARALADEAANDPLGACDRAAIHAEADWQLPAGLLAAIATVESGRSDLGRSLPVAWPWSINAAGRGFYPPSKAAAVATVRELQDAGLQIIDVGCFQVDLYYHPEAFITLDAAFDPETNAQAAARILTDSWSSGGSWEAAIGLYHSATAALGAHYRQQVLAVWPGARTRSGAAAAAGPEAHAVLLSPAAGRVRIITPTDEAVAPAADVPTAQDTGAVLQWVAAPQPLPVILVPQPGASVRSPAHFGPR
jgi:soluble lytic murein transglycosylase-like protein